MKNTFSINRARFFLDAAIILVLIYAAKMPVYELSCWFFSYELDPYSYRNMEPRWPHYFVLFLGLFSAACVFYLLRGKFTWKLRLLQGFFCVLPAFILEAILLRTDFICNPVFADLELFFGATLLYLPFLIFQPGFYVSIFSFLFTPLSFSFLVQVSQSYLLKKNQLLR